MLRRLTCIVTNYNVIKFNFHTNFQITIKEEDRLASVVADIDEDVKIVPRGAFVKTPTGLVVPNRSFEGISSFSPE